MRFLRALAKIIAAGCILAALACGVSYWAYLELEKWGSDTQQLSTPIEIELSRGTSIRQFSKQLESAGLVDEHLFYEWWVRLFSKYRKYQAGPYQFSGAVSPALIDQTIRRGEIFEPIILEVSIPEGFTANQIFERAAANGIGSVDSLLAASKNKNLLDKFQQLPRSIEIEQLSLNGIEGYLFPATYRFTEIPSEKEFIELLIKTFFERLPDDFETLLETTDLSLHQAVILASLIERETQLDSERAIVSEVIHNRLKQGVALGIDASIIYGIPDFDGNLRRKHLNDKTNPFNTRKIRGLPPGPICSPGEASLRAVASPTDHGYWYYVVDADDFSRHRFSRTLKEHNRNVSAFWRAKKKHKG